MKKDYTEIVFILDRSGSMSGLEADTIGGFNSMLAKQQKEPGEAVFSTVLFDDSTQVLHNRVNLRDVRPITDKEYYVRGCTALLDALGGAIDHIRTEQKQMPKDERPEKTLFIITTDGMENASRHYSLEKVRKMIEKRKSKNGWEFIFLGANIDAIEVAGNFGISASRAVNWHHDAAGAALNFKVVSDIVGSARHLSAMKLSETLDEDALSEIREDYEKRPGK